MGPRTLIAVVAAVIAAVAAWASWKSALSSEKAYELQRSIGLSQLIQSISAMPSGPAKGTTRRLCKGVTRDTAEIVAEAIYDQNCAELFPDLPRTTTR
jgi:hypothetical protein